MLQEWFHFVDKERQVRVNIDAKVAQLLDEAAELKTWTISQVRNPGTVCGLPCSPEILVSAGHIPQDA